MVGIHRDLNKWFLSADPSKESVTLEAGVGSKKWASPLACEMTVSKAIHIHGGLREEHWEEIMQPHQRGALLKMPDKALSLPTDTCPRGPTYKADHTLHGKMMRAASPPQTFFRRRKQILKEYLCVPLSTTSTFHRRKSEA